MKAFLKAFRNRSSQRDGWALAVKGSAKPLWWTVSTNRDEAREMKKTADSLGIMDLEVVPVRITVERVK